MKTNFKTHFLAGLLICATGAVMAQTSNSVVTFSVDMSAQITGGTFSPGVDSIEAHGTFNGWGALVLTNDSTGPNPTVYSQTATDTADANGGTLQYKFVINGSNWENPASGQNRAARLPSESGGTLVLPTAFFSDAGPAETNPVTFQVDMAQQINIGAFDPDTQIVYARGAFNGWGTSELTNDPSILVTNQYGLVTSNVYVGTFDVTASHGAAEGYKFFFNNGVDQWESPSAANADGGGNRFYANVPQTLPIVFFNDAPYAPVATNTVTFRLDMSAQVLSGKFDPSADVADVRGTFNGWTGGINILTNDPAAANTNIYSAQVTIKDGVGATEMYKFAYSGPGGDTWESPNPSVSPTIGNDNNRYFVLENASSQLLPVYFFSDVFGSDLLQQDTEVTFSVSMTNAMQYGTSTPFDPGVDTVFLNGDFLGWWPWGLSAPPQFQMVNDPPGSEIYTLTLVVPKGTSLQLTYKYGIDGYDNEAAVGQNHVRLVRSAQGNYTMPMDQFGKQLVEPSFGNLAIGSPSSGNIPITWLGRPGVHLQTSTNLANGTWQDHVETDGLGSTNWPVGNGAVFFRLIKPGT